MNSRSKKYFNDSKNKNEKSRKQNIKAVKKEQDNPALQKTSPNQDDTGGGHNTGKRSDDN